MLHETVHDRKIPVILKYNFILPLLCTSRNDIYTCSLGEIARSRETGGFPDIFRQSKNRRCQK